jgi:predicted RNase H-like HicB family nuclease
MRTFENNQFVRIMDYIIELEQETDGRWIADVINLPGVMVYGNSREEAFAKAQALALRVEAEKLDNGERSSFQTGLFFRAA